MRASAPEASSESAIAGIRSVPPSEPVATPSPESVRQDDSNTPTSLWNIDDTPTSGEQTLRNLVHKTTGDVLPEGTDYEDKSNRRFRSLPYDETIEVHGDPGDLHAMGFPPSGFTWNDTYDDYIPSSIPKYDIAHSKYADVPITRPEYIKVVPTKIVRVHDRLRQYVVAPNGKDFATFLGPKGYQPLELDRLEDTVRDVTEKDLSRAASASDIAIAYHKMSNTPDDIVGPPAYEKTILRELANSQAT